MALDFDGNDAVLIDDFNDAGDSNKQISVCAWAEEDADVDEDVIYVAHYDYGIAQRAWRLSRHPVDGTKMEAIIDLNGAGTSQKQYISSVNAIAANVRHHLGFTFNAGTFRLYIDGVVDPNPTKMGDAAITTVLNSTAKITIASQLNSGAVAQGASAIIGDTRIYNRALSADEFKAIFESGGTDGVVNGLVGHWRMNEKPDGTTSAGASSVIDISKEGHHGSPSGNPVYRADELKLARAVVA